jgi:aspartate-semialdehyde dehydrogenase
MGPINKTKSFTVAIVGATGMVGREFINILEERKFPIAEMRLFASARSAGEAIAVNGKSTRVRELTKGCFDGTDIVFLSAGSSASREWSPQAVMSGAFAIDNSSAWRMDPEVALVVPEVNGSEIPSPKKPGIIATPNCAAIQLAVALRPLQKKFGLKQVIVSTYQSASGAGNKGIEELSRGTVALLNGQDDFEPKIFAHDLAFNNLPQIDKFDESGFTFEEKKLMQETQKILGDKKLNISVTCVRTPTFNGHSEAVWVELAKEVSRKEFMDALSKGPGIVIQDDTTKNEYPLNRAASGQDEVFVGRIRRDLQNPKLWLMWVVADNVRKGAALNAIQIAEKLFDL